MNGCHLIDTFPDFMAFWASYRERSLCTQIDAWASNYMRNWPELLQMQIEDYQSQHLDWRQIASERVFANLPQHVDAMHSAHLNLLGECQPIVNKARKTLGSSAVPDMTAIIYVGIGCGSGWVTQYQEKPAILFGLENIAECGWSEPPAIAGLIAHELGHVVLHHWREQQGVPLGTGSWWQLYEEGFAQCCEHIILGEETWHMTAGLETNWLGWCKKNRHFLAKRFLQAVTAGAAVTESFGSWYDIQGYSQTGYYLGHEAIRYLEGRLNLLEIATMAPDDVETQIRSALMEISIG